MKRSAGIILIIVMTIATTSSLFMLAPQQPVVGQLLDQYVYLPLLVKNYQSKYKIAFLSARDGNNEIFVINSDGTGLTQITRTDYPTMVAAQSWSPDGKKIAYQADQSGGFGIYLADAGGSQTTLLTYGMGYGAYMPAWSPDGKKIAYISCFLGNDEIVVINTDGSGESRLTYNDSYDHQPTWTPDGSKIVFISDGEINMMNQDGSGIFKIPNLSDFLVYEFDLSPDGSKITFYGAKGNDLVLYVVNSSGTGLTVLANGLGPDVSPRWSPDGTKIMYVCASNICTIDADGTHNTPLTDNYYANEFPDWSAYGNKIAFSSSRDGNNEIYTMNADGTGLERLTTDPATDLIPIWQP